MDDVMLVDRINVATFPLYNKKESNVDQPIGGDLRNTGIGIKLNQIQNLSVLSFEGPRPKNAVELLVNEDDSANRDFIVQTPTGFHVYVNTDDAPVFVNFNKDCFVCADFTVSLYAGVERDVFTPITLSRSLVLNNRKNFTYFQLQGDDRQPLTRSITDVLNDLNISLSLVQKPEYDNIIKRNRNSGDVTDELCEKIVEGLQYLPLDQIDEKIIFPAINALNNDYIQMAYQTLYYEMDGIFVQSLSHYKSSVYILTELIKKHNSQFFKSNILPIIQKNRTIYDIDFDDPFTVLDIRSKAMSYITEQEVISDLSRVIRLVEDGSNTYILKVYDTVADSMTVTYKSELGIKQLFGHIKLPKLQSQDKKKQLTVSNILMDNLDELAVLGVKFYNNPPSRKFFSLFQGYKYKDLGQNYDESVVDKFTDFVWTDICNTNIPVYQYLISWVAYIVQNPGKITETAIVLKGDQGVGKNRFTDTICQMLVCYSAPNVVDIKEITGKNNQIIEGKMLIVLNEMRNYGESKVANFDTLKSRITDKTVRITQTGCPAHDVENSANYIFVSNHPHPIHIEAGDRRYVVIECSSRHKGDFQFWEELVNSINQPGFYDNLLTFFLHTDITGFNPREFPHTEARRSIISLGFSAVEEWVCQHYNDLIAGMLVTYAIDTRPAQMKAQAFKIALEGICDRQFRTVGTRRLSYYVMKQEYRNIYYQIIY